MKPAIRSGLLTAALLLLTVPAMAQVADLVLRNGAIWTVDDDNPRAEAMASVDDRILYVQNPVIYRGHRFSSGIVIIDSPDGAIAQHQVCYLGHCRNCKKKQRCRKQA